LHHILFDPFFQQQHQQKKLHQHRNRTLNLDTSLQNSTVANHHRLKELESDLFLPISRPLNQSQILRAIKTLSNQKRQKKIKVNNYI
jgi:hypothetical protein